MSDNLISRSALIETINKISFYSVHNGEFIEGAGLKDVAYYRERDIYRAIIDAPTIEERPRGKWEFVQYDANPNIGNWHCSKCRYIQFTMDRPKYCPNCGAHMVG